MTALTNTPFLFHDFATAATLLTNALVSKKESYLLLIGDSGSGKTALTRYVCENLDKNTITPLYICARPGLQLNITSILAKYLHLPISICCSRSETAHLVTLALQNTSAPVLLIIDEAQFLLDNTLHELRLLVEAHFMAQPLLSILLCGLPSLFERMATPQLFPVSRRFKTKIRLRGLLLEEIAPFLNHSFEPSIDKRFSPQALTVIFEHARGLPATILASVAECLACTHNSQLIDKQSIVDFLASINAF